MKHQVDWNEVIYNEFCRLAMLNELERNILHTRIQGHSMTQQAMEFNISERTVGRITNRLKNKYDAVQLHSGILPRRKVDD